MLQSTNNSLHVSIVFFASFCSICLSKYTNNQRYGCNFKEWPNEYHSKNENNWKDNFWEKELLIILYREALFAGPNLVGKYVVELILKQLSVWNWNWFKEYMPIFMAIRRNTWWRRCNYFLSSFTCSMTLCIFHLVTHFQEPLNEIESVANIPKLLWEIFDVRLGLVVCNKYDIWYVTVTSVKENT